MKAKKLKRTRQENGLKKQRPLLPFFILHRAIPVTSAVGYARKKGNSLHRGYNPAMKNKRSASMRAGNVVDFITLAY